MTTMTKELYIKYLENRCTAEELRKVVQWINSNTFEKDTKEWGFDNWNSFNDFQDTADDEKFNTLFEKIHDRINSEESSTTKNTTNNTRVLFTWLTRAAAILFFPLLSFFLYTIIQKELPFNNSYVHNVVDSLEVTASASTNTIIHLADGTKVQLNNGSKIVYPRLFTGDTREVKLSGEGFFEVAHNPEKPFVVKTKKLNVKALGTTFNVLAYPESDVVRTTLVEGKVVLEECLGKDKSRVLGVMVPGQHVKYHRRSGNVESEKGDIERYIAWKDGKMIFKDTPIAEVVRQLERKYNVNVKISDECREYYYTVTFLDEPLFQILDLMTIATPIQYKLIKREKKSDGSFSKQKIVIEKK